MPRTRKPAGKGKWSKGPAHAFFPADELARLDQAAKQAGMTRAAFLRQAALAAANDVLAGYAPPWFRTRRDRKQ